jgi:hypothetical protein
MILHYRIILTDSLNVETLRLLKSRIIHQIPKQVFKEIKGLILVVNKIYDEVVKF